MVFPLARSLSPLWLFVHPTSPGLVVGLSSVSISSEDLKRAPKKWKIWFSEPSEEEGKGGRERQGKGEGLWWFDSLNLNKRFVRWLLYLRSMTSWNHKL